MNVLMDSLPSTVMIGGRPYPINTDFRAGIELEELMEDDSISQKERVLKALKIYFQPVPDLHYIEDAMSAINWFYVGYEEREAKPQEGGKEREKYFSYAYDAEYIFSAILQQYGLNLQKESVHWWVFRALIRGLSKDTEFIKIVGYRAMKITNDMSRKEKEYYRKMKQLYALPANKQESEQQDFILRALMNGGDLSGITERYAAEQRRKEESKMSPLRTSK